MKTTKRMVGRCWGCCLAAWSMFLAASVAAETKVGVIAPLAGDFARYGARVLSGVKRGAGNGIRILVEDDGCKPAQAISAYQKLASLEQVRFFLGPVCGSPQLAVAPLLKRDRGVAIVGSSAPRSLHAISGGRIFSSQYTIETESTFNADQAFRLGARRIIIIFRENGFSRSHEAAFRSAFKGQVLETIAYTSDDPAALDEVVVRVKTTGADAVYVPDALPLLQGLPRELRRVGLAHIKVFGVYATQSEDVLRAIAGASEGLIYSYPDIGERDALEFFPERAAQILSAALSKCEGRGEDCVLDRLRSDNAFNGDGALAGGLRLKTIRQGTFVNFER